MTMPRKFWSNRMEDTFFISLIVIGTLGLYLAAAYFFITVL
jgi:hypothetical protein